MKKSIINHWKKFWAFYAIGILIMFFALVPTLWGYATAQNRQYIAANYINAGDLPVYFSYLEQARQGHWLFANLYTSEPQQYSYFSPLWLVLGQVGRLVPWSNSSIFIIAQILAIILFFYVVYHFIALIYSKNNNRLLAFALVGLSAGWGVFLSPKKLPDNISLDMFWQIFPADMVSSAASHRVRCRDISP